jgi:hypothetical protein
VYLDVINTSGRGSTPVSEIQAPTRLYGHGHAQLNRYPKRVANVKCAALIGNIDPIRRKPKSVEVELCCVEVVLARNAKSKPLSRRIASTAENEAVMCGLLYAAEIHGLTVLRSHDESDNVLVKPPACRMIPNVHHDMTQARDAKR